jgi:DNA mismatch repair protein MutS
MPAAEAEGRATPVRRRLRARNSDDGASSRNQTTNPNCLRFYLDGRFYELFFDDAEIASRALGIMLTKRGKHLGREIPMCGVPVERADDYLHRLIELSHRVAVCEQLEDPAEAKKRGNKSVVRRDVIRLVTPGTLTEDTLLDANRNNYLLAIVRARISSSAEDSRFALAWIDISTAEFRIAECDRLSLAAEIARLEQEISFPMLYADAELRRSAYATRGHAVASTPSTVHRRASARTFCGGDNGVWRARGIELNAAAACITYVERTQTERPPLPPPCAKAAGATPTDQATRKSRTCAHHR